MGPPRPGAPPTFCAVLSARPKNVGSQVRTRLVPSFAACFSTSIVAIAVVAIPVTWSCGVSLLRKPSGLKKWPVAGELRSQAVDDYFGGERRGLA